MAMTVLNRDEILKLLRQFKDERGAFYHIQTIGLCGSFARGNMMEDSDIDIALSVERPSFFTLIPLEDELRNRISPKVHLIEIGEGFDKNSSIYKGIEKDVIYV